MLEIDGSRFSPPPMTDEMRDLLRSTDPARDAKKQALKDDILRTRPSGRNLAGVGFYDSLRREYGLEEPQKVPRARISFRQSERLSGYFSFTGHTLHDLMPLYAGSDTLDQFVGFEVVLDVVHKKRLDEVNPSDYKRYPFLTVKVFGTEKHDLEAMFDEPPEEPVIIHTTQSLGEQQYELLKHTGTGETTTTVFRHEVFSDGSLDRCEPILLGTPNHEGIHAMALIIIPNKGITSKHAYI